MSTLKHAAALLLAFAFAVPLVASTPETQLTGRLLAEDGSPVAYATVALLTLDSTLVDGEVTDIDGAFAIDGVAAGEYLLRAESIEYQTQYVTVDEQVLAKADGLTITMHPSAHGLQTATVTGRRALVEIKADRMVFNVSSMPSASGTTVLDALRKAPGVQVDMDNNILLLGKSGVQVYINGKPTRLAGQDLATLLIGMPSDNVEAIDLITNPGARYEAEGTAGIIDIRLKTNVATGFNGSAFASATRGRYLRTNEGLSINYGGLRVRASVDLTHSYIQDLTNFIDTKRQSGFRLDQNSYELNTFTPTTAALGLEVQLSPKQTLSLTARGRHTGDKGRVNNTTEIFRGESTLEEVLVAQTNLDGRNLNTSVDLGYALDLGEGERLNADVSYGNFDNDQSTDQPNTFFGPDRATVRDIQNSAFDARSLIDLYSGKVDYEKSWDKVSLAVGGKYAGIDADNNLAFFTVNDGQRTFDQTRSNRFTYAENVLAAYATANVKLGSKYTLDAGLRVESTNSHGQLLTEASTANKDVRRAYVDFFPNVGLSFNAQGDHTWSASLGRRISRPNYRDLNPFSFPLSQLAAWQGNPFLSPQYTTNYQVQYAFRQKLTVSTSYAVTSDFFANVFELDGEQGTRIIPRNMQEATNLNTSISYPQEITDGWDVMGFAEASYQTFAGDLEGTVIDLTNFNYSFRLQNNVKLPLGITMDLTARYGSDWVWRGSVEVKGNANVDFGLRKDFLDKRLQLRLTGGDIFRTNTEFDFRSEYGGIATDGVVVFDNRRFGMGLTYKFGDQQVKARTKRGGALDDEMDRL